MSFKSIFISQSPFLSRLLTVDSFHLELRLLKFITGLRPTSFIGTRKRVEKNSPSHGVCISVTTPFEIISHLLGHQLLSGSDLIGLGRVFGVDGALRLILPRTLLLLC